MCKRSTFPSPALRPTQSVRWELWNRPWKCVAALPTRLATSSTSFTATISRDAPLRTQTTSSVRWISQSSTTLLSPSRDGVKFLSLAGRDTNVLDVAVGWNGVTVFPSRKTHPGHHPDLPFRKRLRWHLRGHPRFQDWRTTCQTHLHHLRCRKSPTRRLRSHKALDTRTGIPSHSCRMVHPTVPAGVCTYAHSHPRPERTRCTRFSDLARPWTYSAYEFTRIPCFNST